MIAGLDSSFTPPSAAMADAAKAAGISVWSGYIATQSNVGIGHAWTRGDFENARRCGGTPIAYASGRDDPVACQQLARNWNVRLALDVESSIRGDGSWVQGWLDQSGAGLYGNAPVFAGRRAAFYIFAAYPGADPKATWPPKQPRPSGPCGWQWQGSTGAFGATVDRTWLDDWFGGKAAPSPTTTEDDVLLIFTKNNAQFLSNLMTYRHITSPTEMDDIHALSVEVTGHTVAVHQGEIADTRAFGIPEDAESAGVAGDTFDAAKLDRIEATLGDSGYGLPAIEATVSAMASGIGLANPGGSLTADQATALANVQTILARIEGALKSA